MNLNNAYKIVLLFFLIGINLGFNSQSVYSVPPITTNNYYNIVQVNTEGLIIEYPKNMYYAQNKSITLNVHVYNSSSYWLDNATTQCLIHIYNNSGNHIVNQNLTYDADKGDFQYNNLAGFEHIGVYPYIIQCESDTESGFVSTTFNINFFGEEPKTPSSVAVMPIIIMLILALFMIVCSIVLHEEHTAFKFFLMFLSVVPFFTALHFSVITLIRFYDFPELAQEIGTTVYWFGLMFFVIMSYFFMYLMYKLFIYFVSTKKARFNY